MSSHATAASSASLRVFACERCSRRKQRCDRILPVCSPCLATQSSCTMSEREKGVVQLNDNEVARKGYVTNLLERIASLEARLSERQPQIPSSPDHSQQVQAMPDTPSLISAASETAGPNHSQWPLDDSHGDMGSLSLRAMAEPRNRAGEFLKQLSMPRIIASVTETYGGNPESTTRVDALWDGISKYIRHPEGYAHRLYVQPKEAQKSLETYMDLVDFRYPRLPVHKVKSGLDAISDSEDALYREKLNKEPSHIFMAYMIIAIVPLVSDNYPISQGSFVSIQLLSKCLKVLNRVFRLEDGVDIIECLHLLVIFSIHCSAAGSSWHLIGFAMNKCVALGYHRDLSTMSPGIPAEELEQRRWAFWGCYLLDRLICAALGRPCSIDDRYITVSLPGQDGILTSCPNLLECFHVHLFSYAQLLSSAINEDAKGDFDQHFSRVLRWRMLTPPHTKSSARQPYYYLTSLFNTLMLRLAVREILTSFRFPVSMADHSAIQYMGAPLPLDVTASDLDLECSRLQKVKLFDICCDVATSLDRTSMTGRHFLSSLTGYSAFAMALATIYYNTVVTRSGLRLSSECFSSTGAAWTCTAVLTIACQKLDIVGRQFPRMQAYKQIIEGLWAQGDIVTTPTSIGQPPESLDTLIMTIGPPQLRKLAQAIFFLKK